LPGFLRSAHRAGALDVAFKRMGDMVLEDMALLDSGLPPHALQAGRARDGRAPALPALSRSN
jgi:hypothetical protein